MISKVDMLVYNAYTDAELIALLKGGDIKAFNEIHARYFGILYRHAYKRLQDREEVQDVLQELFTNLWNQKESINSHVNLAGYLYTSVRNRILNHYKYCKVRSNYIASLSNFIENSQPEADEQLRVKELIAVVESEVSKLPPQMRLIFEMSRNLHLSHQEIAEQLNISALTVRKQVSNSLKILRVKLGTLLFLLFF